MVQMCANDTTINHLPCAITKVSIRATIGPQTVIEPTACFRARQLASVAQLVRALYRNRRAAGSIPARGSIVAFFTNYSCLYSRSNKFIKFTIPIYIKIILQFNSSVDFEPSPESNNELFIEAKLTFKWYLNYRPCSKH